MLIRMKMRCVRQANCSDAIGWTGLHHAAFLNHVLVTQVINPRFFDEQLGSAIDSVK